MGKQVYGTSTGHETMTQSGGVRSQNERLDCEFGYSRMGAQRRERVQIQNEDIRMGTQLLPSTQTGSA